MDEVDDASLPAAVAAVAAGDGGALAVRYRRHGRALFGHLLRFCGDRTIAEEVLRDTFAALWRRWLTPSRGRA